MPRQTLTPARIIDLTGATPTALFMFERGWAKAMFRYWPGFPFRGRQYERHERRWSLVREFVLLQSVNDTHPRFIKAVPFVGIGFGGVNVKADSFGHGGAARLQGGAGKRQAGVQTKGRRETRMGICCQPVDESKVLFNSSCSLSGPSRSVTS